MTLAVHPAEGPATTLGIPADLAFAGEAWCWLEDAMPLVAADSMLQPHALADLLRAGFFSPSDDAALHLATRLLLSDEDACRASIAEAIADWLPDCRPTVVLMNPPFSATPGVGRIRHGADLRHLRAAFAMLPPGGRLAAVSSAQCVPGDPAWTAVFAQHDPPAHCVFTLAIDGCAYARRGTGFDTRLTVLDREARAANAAELLGTVITRVPRGCRWNPYRSPSAPTATCSAAPGRPSPPTPRPETTRKRGNRAASQQGRASLKLQNALPDARIAYVSATGATTVPGLAYARRLGLWAAGETPFKTRTEFVSAMEAGGVAAMEVVARDLKALGLYQARALAYDGVEVDILEHPLTPEQRRIHNAYAGAFKIIHTNIEAALKATGIVDGESTLNRNAKSAAHSAFEGAKQRFFGHLLTGMKCPALIRAIETGRAVVIQLVSTGAALMERRIAEIPASEWDDLTIDLTPRDGILSFLMHAFPVHLQEPFTDDGGTLMSRPVTDPDGNPVICREAEARRDALIEKLAALPPVPAALDRIVQHFGHEAVAEVTGRSRRVLRIAGWTAERFRDATGLAIVHEGNLKDDLPPMPKFLNRLLALPIAELEARIAANIEQAIEAGSYEAGVETVTADSLAVAGRETLYAHPGTGAKTELVEIIRRDKLEPLSAGDVLEAASRHAGTCA